MFYETLPSNQLDLALFLEADRMRSLRLDQARLDTERATIGAERQQRYDNAPYGRAGDVLVETAYDIPRYKQSGIGTAATLQTATLQEVNDFFKIFYAPNNAVLTVVGDFKPADARARIENYFQHIAAQPPAPVPDLTSPAPTRERRVRIEDPFAPAPRHWVAYLGTTGAAPDFEATQVLAEILGGGAASRLHQKLVHKRTRPHSSRHPSINARGLASSTSSSCRRPSATRRWCSKGSTRSWPRCGSRA